MKRIHIEQSNILLQQRMEQESKGEKPTNVFNKTTAKKADLFDKLINQLKNEENKTL